MIDRVCFRLATWQEWVHYFATLKHRIHQEDDRLNDIDKTPCRIYFCIINNPTEGGWERFDIGYIAGDKRYLSIKRIP